MNHEFSVKESAVATPQKVIIDTEGVHCRKSTYKWENIDGLLYLKWDIQKFGVTTNNQFLIMLRDKNYPKKWMDLSSTTAMKKGNDTAEKTYNAILEIILPKLRPQLVKNITDNIAQNKQEKFGKAIAFPEGLKIKGGLFSGGKFTLIPWERIAWKTSSVQGYTTFYDKEITRNEISLYDRFWNVVVLRDYVDSLS